MSTVSVEHIKHLLSRCLDTPWIGRFGNVPDIITAHSTYDDYLSAMPVEAAVHVFVHVYWRRSGAKYSTYGRKDTLRFLWRCGEELHIFDVKLDKLTLRCELETVHGPAIWHGTYTYRVSRGGPTGIADYFEVCEVSTNADNTLPLPLLEIPNDKKRPKILAAPRTRTNILPKCRPTSITTVNMSENTFLAELLAELTDHPH